MGESGCVGLAKSSTVLRSFLLSSRSLADRGHIWYNVELDIGKERKFTAEPVCRGTNLVC